MPVTAEQIVQNNLDCYNQRDIEGFVECLSDEIRLFSLGESEPTSAGIPQMREMYGALFENSPKLHSTILQRMVIGNKVIDHESIVGRNGMAETLQLVLVYEVKDDKIYKITVIRE